MYQRKDCRRSWSIATGTCFLMFLETGVVKSLGVLLPDIREQFATKTWVVGFAIALVPGLGAVVCMSSGAFTKVWSARACLVVCGLLSAVGLLGTSMAPDVYTLMATLLLTGFSTGTTTVSMAVLSVYFDKYYNVAVTLASCGQSLGIVIMPLMSQFLLDIYGWRGTTLLLSGISFNAVLCGVVFKPSNTDRSYTAMEQQQSDETKDWFSYIYHSLDMDLFSNFAFVSLIIINAGMGYTLTGWLIYIVPHGLDAGLSPYKASTVSTVAGIGNVIGVCFVPALDKIMPSKLQLYISIFVISAALALDPVASSLHPYAGMIVCSTAFSFARGIGGTSWYAVLNKAVNDEKKMVNAIAWSYAVYGMSSIIAGFSIGWMFDRYGNYHASFLVLGGVIAASAIPQCILDIMTFNRVKPAPI